MSELSTDQPVAPPAVAGSPSIEVVIDDNSISKQIEKIALGFIAFVSEIFILLKTSPIIYCLFSKLKKSGIDMISNKQEIIRLLNFVSHYPNKLTSSILKIVVLGYITLAGPLVTEFFFRGKLFAKIKKLQSNPDSLLSKIFRVFLNALLFSLTHFSPMQGWANIPIISCAFLLGLIFTSLREATGDIVASSTCQILHNSFVTYCLFKGIDIYKFVA